MAQFVDGEAFLRDTLLRGVLRVGDIQYVVKKVFA